MYLHMYIYIYLYLFFFICDTLLINFFYVDTMNCVKKLTGPTKTVSLNKHLETVCPKMPPDFNCL